MLRIGTNGNVAISFAIIAPALLAAAGLAIDFQQLTRERVALQDAADSLALRGAKELLLENATKIGIESLIRTWAAKQYSPTLGVVDTKPKVSLADRTVTVEVTKASFSGFLLTKIKPSMLPIKATATAQAEGVSNVCVIALEETTGNAIRAGMAAQLDAQKCAILSNSTDKSSINVTGVAKLSAGVICSAGGADGAATNFSPAPLTDCPVYADPLSERIPPTVGPCDYKNLEIGTQVATFMGAVTAFTTAQLAAADGDNPATLPGYNRFDLTPGVYCGGLTINSDADVHLAPGEYIFKDGPLDVDLGARLFGDYVGLYFTGVDATFQFGPASIISLSAPKEGLMAGLLIWEDSSAPAGRAFRILSSNARRLLGTIYMPKGQLEVATSMPVGDESAYTAIVARKLMLSGSSTLVLNSDYAASDVPVPDGISGTGGQVYLRN